MRLMIFAYKLVIYLTFMYLQKPLIETAYPFLPINILQIVENNLSVVFMVSTYLNILFYPFIYI